MRRILFAVTASLLALVLLAPAGSASYSATPCKRWISPKATKYDSWKKRKLPVCKQTW